MISFFLPRLRLSLAICQPNPYGNLYFATRDAVSVVTLE